jgi:hypothetical protein
MIQTHLCFSVIQTVEERKQKKKEKILLMGVLKVMVKKALNAYTLQEIMNF